MVAGIGYNQQEVLSKSAEYNIHGRCLRYIFLESSEATTSKASHTSIVVLTPLPPLPVFRAWTGDFLTGPDRTLHRVQVTTK